MRSIQNNKYQSGNGKDLVTSLGLNESPKININQQQNVKFAKSNHMPLDIRVGIIGHQVMNNHGSTASFASTQNKFNS